MKGTECYLMTGEVLPGRSAHKQTIKIKLMGYKDCDNLY